MRYRLDSLEIPLDEPYRNDALGRKQVVDFLAGLIGRAPGPFVLALDSPWGSGKTTLVKLLQAELQRQTFQCVYFNAWQVDYVTDPLVALVSSIDRIDLAAGEPASSFKKHLKTVRKVTSLVAKRSVVVATKALTAGLLDLDDEIETAVSALASETAGDLVELFQKERELLKKFRSELQAAIDELPRAGKKATLVFFIDELDRCRPTFAIELLERVKHLFDVPNIVFVLSIDKGQLEASTAAVYGDGINAAEYLRRFIDLEFGIPRAETKAFVEALMIRFELDQAFALRQGELSYDQRNFATTFVSLANIYDLSLRAIERCMTRLCIVLDQTPNNHYLDPVLVALLVVLRVKERDLFERLHRGHASPSDVMKRLSSLPDGKKFVDSRGGMFLEAHLICADEDQQRQTSRDSELAEQVNGDKTPVEVRQRATTLIEMRRSIYNSMRGQVQLSYSAAKVDMAARLRD